MLFEHRFYNKEGKVIESKSDLFAAIYENTDHKTVAVRNCSNVIVSEDSPISVAGTSFWYGTSVTVGNYDIKVTKVEMNDSLSPEHYNISYTLDVVEKEKKKGKKLKKKEEENESDDIA